MSEQSSSVNPARAAITAVENTCRELYSDPPYFHVGDVIRNRKDLAALNRGQFYAYARFRNHPDHVRLERWLADYYAGSQAFRIYPSGMAAIAASLYGAIRQYYVSCPLLTSTSPEIIAFLPLYGSTYELLCEINEWREYDVNVFFLEAPESVDEFEQLLKEEINGDTIAVISEFFANPTLGFADPQKIGQALSKFPPENKPLFIIDDTFSFGLRFKPFRWGADAVVSSGTKYLSGESAWTLGYLGISQECAKHHTAFLHEVDQWTMLRGGPAAPFESWAAGALCVQTVDQRIKTHSRNAMRVAKFLDTHPSVARVIYPGLPDYQGYPRRILKYLGPIDGEFFFGGMVSFYLKTDDPEKVLDFLFAFGGFRASLGGPEDMIESPALLSHRGMDKEDRIRLGITPNLIRLSVGLGPAEETINRLDHALSVVISY